MDPHKEKKLGNVLFCLTAEGIHEEKINRPIPPTLSPSIPQSPLQAIPEQYRRTNLTSTPCLSDSINANFATISGGTRNKKNVIRDIALDDTVGLEPRLRADWAVMYIDDLSIGEVHDMNTSVSLFSQRKEERRRHARICEDKFKIITENANSIGMKINEKKTQLICFSDSNFSNTKSFINIDDEDRIYSEDNMKVLGFIFSSKPGVGAHVDYMSKKFKKSLWSLHHLKRANIPNDRLILVYCTMLRAIIEFSNVVYHSMLTEEQNKSIEGLQKMALKIILGFGKPYEVLLEESGLESLQERRERAFLKFANQLCTSPRYGHWFPECESSLNLRSSKKYQEHYARTSRLYNSPIFTMRRLLNKTYSETIITTQETNTDTNILPSIHEEES